MPLKSSKLINEIKEVLLITTLIPSHIQTILEDAGYDVLLVQEPHEGLARAAFKIPDLIVWERSLPVVEILDFVRQVKRNKDAARVPFIVLLDEASTSDRERFDVEEVLVKPVEDYALLYKAACLLNPKKAFSHMETQKRVLIAGSDDDVVKRMGTKLRAEGCQTCYAFEEGELVSQCILFKPNLIIMEVQIEGVRSSAETVQVIRRLPEYRRVPILVYSHYNVTELGTEELHQKALSLDACQRSCREAGADAYIGKFNENTFLKSLEQYL